MSSRPRTKIPAPRPIKLGRPSGYTEQIARVICIRIAEGESLREIVKSPNMPDRTVVYDWLLRDPDFAIRYTRAREEQAETLADEIIAIADESPETVELRDKEGNLLDIKIDSGYVQYQKQRIEARKWTAMKLKPTKYGEKIVHAGDDVNPVVIEQNINVFGELLKSMKLRRQSES